MFLKSEIVLKLDYHFAVFCFEVKFKRHEILYIFKLNTKKIFEIMLLLELFLTWPSSKLIS